MSDTPLPTSDRCPHCDTVVGTGASLCPLCGKRLDTPKPAKSHKPKAAVSKPIPPAKPILVTAVPARRRPFKLWLLPLIIVAMTAVALLLIWQNRPSPVAVVAEITDTPLPPTNTPTLTPTPEATPTDLPPDTPTITPTPLPTDTPQPPRAHRVSANETLYGLSFIYSVSVDSIVELNELGEDEAIRVNEELLIPWPTPTPPLVPVSLEIGGETIVADPTGCEQYVIQSGDNLFAIAANRRIPLEALQRVNRLTDQSLIRPGDTLCIPEIIRGGLIPPTPGPSPTPTVTPPPAGPQLLFPPREATITHPDGPGLLQWAHVKALTADEYYMVELLNLSQPDSRPYRAFTRDTAVRIPLTLRPDQGQTELFRWRVTIIRVTGQRTDGQFTYTYGGNPSIEALFYWANEE
jgi:LysM repeat protein